MCTYQTYDIIFLPLFTSHTEQIILKWAVNRIQLKNVIDSQSDYDWTIGTSRDASDMKHKEFLFRC